MTPRNLSGDIFSLLIKINLLFFCSIIIYNILMNVIFFKSVAYCIEEIVHIMLITSINIVVIKKIKKRFKDDSIL